MILCLNITEMRIERTIPDLSANSMRCPHLLLLELTKTTGLFEKFVHVAEQSRETPPEALEELFIRFFVFARIIAPPKGIARPVEQKENGGEEFATFWGHGDIFCVVFHQELKEFYAHSRVLDDQHFHPQRKNAMIPGRRVLEQTMQPRMNRRGGIANWHNRIFSS